MSEVGVQIEKILGGSKDKIKKFSDEITDSTKKYKNDLQSMLEILKQIDESWSGSWFGFHADLYYEDFQRPPWNERFDSELGSIHGIPKYWKEKTDEDIDSFVNERYKGIQIDKIRNSLLQTLEKGKGLQSEICSDLSFIRGFENFDKEIEILDKIEKQKWELSPNEYIGSITPQKAMTRDSYAASQGFRAPPHIQYQSKVIYLLSIITSVEKFIDSTKRLLRQVEVRTSFKITLDAMERDKFRIFKYRFFSIFWVIIVNIFFVIGYLTKFLNFTTKIIIAEVLVTILILSFAGGKPEETLKKIKEIVPFLK